MELLPTSTEEQSSTWFKTQSLGLLAMQLTQITYAGYPANENRAYEQQRIETLQETDGPSFARQYKEIPLPNADQQNELRAQGLQLDTHGRPIHPWFEDMLANPNIGVASGNGFYWNYGPNKTADPIVIRHDLPEPHVLLVVRGDTGNLALPGGFVDTNEEPQHAAEREAKEETGFDISAYTHTRTDVYDGPLADIRVTAHAWPHTSAFAYNIERAVTGPMEWHGSDDAIAAGWKPARDAAKLLFGSHKLLVELALNRRF